MQYGARGMAGFDVNYQHVCLFRLLALLGASEKAQTEETPIIHYSKNV